jgi:hypothetical protein
MALYGEGVEDSGEEECEGSDEEGDEDTSPLPSVEGDQEDLKRDGHPFDGEGLLAAEEAAKLLVLMCHARYTF